VSDNSSMSSHTRTKRLRKIRRRIFRSVRTALVCLLAIAAAVYGIGFFVIVPAAQSSIARFCGAGVSIQSGWFTGVGSVRLNGVVVAGETASGDESAILRADRMDVQFIPLHLLKGRLSIHSITLSDFAVTADYDAGQKNWNFSRLAFGARNAGGQTAIPLIQMRRGALRIRRIADTAETIATIGFNGDIAVPAGLREYSFRLETDGRFGYGDSSIQGLLTLGQGDRQSRLAAAGYIRMGQARVLDNAWNLEGIQFECTFDAQTVSIQRCRFLLGQGQADIRGLIHRTGRRPVDLEVSAHGLMTADRFEPDAIVCSRPILSLLEPAAARFLGRYHACGKADIEAQMHGYLDDLSDSQFSGRIRCVDIAVRDDQFPYTVSGIQGDIELKGRTLYLNNLKGRHGDSILLVNGTVSNFGPQAEIDLRTTSESIRFDEDLYNALKDSAKRLWLAFKPQGAAGLDYRFRRAADGRKDAAVALHLKNASAVYNRIPYLLENLTGTIRIETGRILFENVRASYDDGRSILISGQAEQLQTEDPVFSVYVEGRRIPTDAALREALPEAAQALWNRLEISAAADFDIRIQSSPAAKEQFDYTAQVRLQGQRLLYKEFPLAIRDVQLSAEIADDRILLHRLEGRTDNGPVVLSGTVYPAGRLPQQAGFCLELELRDFDLNEAFWNIAGIEQMPGKFRLLGRVDVSGRLETNLPETECRGNDLIAVLKESRLAWEDTPLGRLQGRLRIQNETVKLTDFQWQAIPLESLPLDAAGRQVRALYAWARPKGQAGLVVHDGCVRMNSQRKPSGIELNAQVKLEGLSCGAAGQVSLGDGVFSGSAAGDFESQRWEVSGDYVINRLQYRHWLAEHVSGRAAYDPNTMRLKGSNLTAQLYDGAVSGEFQVNLAAGVQPGYLLKLDCQDVPVIKLLEARQPIEPQQQMQGLVSGSLTLQGDFQTPAEPRGRLTAAVVDMKMGRQSLPGKILTAVQLRQPEEFVFSRMDVAAVIRGAELILDDVVMVGQPLIFRGKGRLNLQSRQITMELTAWNRPPAQEDTFLDRLLRGMGAALWRVEVRGDMKDPVVQAVFLSVFRPPTGLF